MRMSLKDHFQQFVDETLAQESRKKKIDVKKQAHKYGKLKKRMT